MSRYLLVPVEPESPPFDPSAAYPIMSDPVPLRNVITALAATAIGSSLIWGGFTFLVLS